MPLAESVRILRGAPDMGEAHLHAALEREHLVEALDHHAQVTVGDLDLGHGPPRPSQRVRGGVSSTLPPRAPETKRRPRWVRQDERSRPLYPSFWLRRFGLNHSGRPSRTASSVLFADRTARSMR